MTLKTMLSKRHHRKKEYIQYDFIYNLQWKKSEQWLSGIEGGESIDSKGVWQTEFSEMKIFCVLIVMVATQVTFAKNKQTNTSIYTLKMWILLHVNDNSKLIPKKERIGKEKWRRKGRREKKRATTTETKSLQAVGQEQDSIVWH